MRTRAFVLSVGVSLTLLAGPAMAGIVYLDGSILPTTTNSILDSNNTPTNKADDFGVGRYDLTSDTNNTAATWTLITDAAAADKKAFRFTDSNAASRSWYNADGNSPTTQLAYIGINGTTYVVKLRIESQSNAEALMGINDIGTQAKTASLLSYNDNGSGVIKEIQRGQTSTPVAADANYHIIRITTTNSGGRAIKVYFDENTTPVINLTAAAGITNGAFDAWLLGSRGGDTDIGTAQYVVDWIAASDDGAFAPGTSNNLNTLITTVLQTPEPATLVLLMLGALPMMRRRSR